jgi:pimeloyl-ACP methyl ester carboxylesterase
MSEQIAAPEWFTRATAAPVESRYTEVDGTPIHYLSWNAADTDKPALLFAHGFRAHARWWSFIAPFFLSRFRIVSIDFAGMGDSGNRGEYTPLGFVHDIVGVLDHAGFAKATLVGHSFGGGRVARACAEVPERIARAVIIDSHMRLTEEKRSTRPFEIGPRRVYATYEVARSRFRLVPPENRAAPYVLDYVARHSLKEVEGGWSWKFDEQLIPKHDDAKAADILASIKVPVTFIYGDASAIVSRQHAHEIVRHIPNARGPIAIPQSHHHVLLDQPLSLVSALRAALY